MNRKLGLQPVKEQPKLKLSDYYTSALPSVSLLNFPFGHATAIQPHMFMNDQLGDCAIAGSIEEVRLANALRGVTVNFTDQTAVENYSAITGYNPDDPNSDQGTDVHQLYQYRQAKGIVDADGKYHKIVAYAGLTPGDFDELLVALSLFDMVGIGINVPDYAEQQFEEKEPWHLVKGRHQIVGGHYISVCGATDIHTAQLYTWGAVQGMTSTFYKAFSTVSVVAITDEILNGDKTPEGINVTQLAADLKALDTGQVSTKAPASKPKKEAE